MNLLRATSWAQFRWATTMMVFGGVILFTYREDIMVPLLNEFTLFTAHVVFLILHFLEPTVAQAGTVIYHPGGFAYEIYFSCTAILPVSFISLSILTYPASWKHKLLGLVISVPLLMAINFTRLLHLFWVGINKSDVFELVHHVFWEGSIVLASIAIWLSWLKGSYSPPSEEASS